MEKKIIIGTVGYPIKNKKTVYQSVDAVELTEARFIPPGKKAAAHIKEALPYGVTCTLRISDYFVTPPPPKASLKGDIANYGDFKLSDESLSLWKRQQDFATAVGAKVLVMVTPGEIRPAGKTVKDMSEFFNKIDRNGLPIVWEPHGLWETDQIMQFAGQHNLIPAVDPLRDGIPVGKIVYFRFGPFSVAGTKMGVYELEQIAAAILQAEAETVYCMFDTTRSLDDVRNLKEILEGDEDDEFDY